MSYLKPFIAGLGLGLGVSTGIILINWLTYVIQYI